MAYPTGPGTPFGSPQGAYPPQAPADPTGVMGRRILAWLIDFVLYFAGALVLFTQLAVKDSTGRFITACDQLVGNNICLKWNDEVIFLQDDSDMSLMFLFALGWFIVVYVLLQGFTGASPGKFLTGIRVVDEQGKVCGPIKSLIRSLLWVVDAAPWVIPGLVGFIVGLTSTGHRRVGDMAASTYVVGSSSVGSPITVGGQTGIPNYAPAGQQSAYGSPWTPNPTMPVTPEPAQASPEGGPVWDQARNTYIQWDATAGRWMQWNETAQAWQPIPT